MSFAEIKMEYRFLAFLLALLVAFSVISVPANAILVETIVGVIGVIGFADLVSYALGSEAFIPTVGHFLHDKLVGAGVLPADGERYSAEQINAAYDSYVADVESVLGCTSMDGSNGYPIYISSFSRVPANLSVPLPVDAVINTGVGYMYIKCAKSSTYMSAVRYWSEPFVCLSYGTYEIQAIQNTEAAFSSLSIGIVWENDDGTWPVTGSSTSVQIAPNANASHLNRRFRILISFIPKSVNSDSIVTFRDLRVVPTALAVIPDSSVISPVNRVSSIITNIISTNSPTNNIAYYIGTVDSATNAVTNVYTTPIVDETASTVTVPGETPMVYNITNWNYDYSTRIYNCTTADDEAITVEYGDDKITVTTPDGNGGTTAQDYYYVRQSPLPTPAMPGSDTEFVTPSSDEVEDDPNTTGGFFSTIWKAFKQGLADLIGGIIKGLFKGIKALINGIMDLFSGIIGKFFDSVGDFFGAFSNDGVFGFFHGDLVIRGPTDVVSA